MFISGIFSPSNMRSTRCPVAAIFLERRGGTEHQNYGHLIMNSLVER